MKRMIMLLLTAVLLLTMAQAESIAGGEYTDTPTAMTQDSVLEVRASEGCQMEVLQPDEASIALLDDVYRFVWKEGNRPARYYDPATQQKIAELAGVIDIDILHMTEAMRLQLSGAPQNEVTLEMLLDVDYQPGQLVIVVLGDRQDDGAYTWYPYRGRVIATGRIAWEVPVAQWRELCRQPVSFHVLTDRIGARGWQRQVEEQEPERYSIFSKDSGDVNRIRSWRTESGAQIEEAFRVMMVELTRPMQEEIVRIGEHLSAGGAALDWFPQEKKDEALLMMKKADDAAMIPYDVVALRCENYKDTYGDVNVEITFGTMYTEDEPLVILAGFPIRGAQEKPFFEWHVLRAEVIGESDCVQIGLKQQNLVRMENEPMMLVVISEPVDAL